MNRRLSLVAGLLLAVTLAMNPPRLLAAPTGPEIGVVVMHGKGGGPGRFVSELAAALEKEGFQVANLNMPWSASRHYEVDLDAAVGEVTRALEEMRSKGAKKLFVSGHSQGGVFALL